MNKQRTLVSNLWCKKSKSEQTRLLSQCHGVKHQTEHCHWAAVYWLLTDGSVHQTCTEHYTSAMNHSIKSTDFTTDLPWCRCLLLFHILVCGLQTGLQDSNKMNTSRLHCQLTVHQPRGRVN